jgi:hypothetical protein
VERGEVTDPAALHGHWTLVSWTGFDEAGEPVSHGGERPRGDLIYLPSGWMAVQIQSDDRATFGSTDLTAGDAAGRAAAYTTYNAYCGTWSMPRDGVIVHHVELAIQPDQPGMDKERRFELEGDELVLHTQPVVTADGREATSVLRWRRA